MHACQKATLQIKLLHFKCISTEKRLIIVSKYEVEAYIPEYVRFVLLIVWAETQEPTLKRTPGPTIMALQSS